MPGRDSDVKVNINYECHQRGTQGATNATWARSDIEGRFTSAIRHLITPLCCFSPVSQYGDSRAGRASFAGGMHYSNYTRKNYYLFHWSAWKSIKCPLDQITFKSLYTKDLFYRNTSININNSLMNYHLERCL